MTLPELHRTMLGLTATELGVIERLVQFFVSAQVSDPRSFHAVQALLRGLEAQRSDSTARAHGYDQSDSRCPETVLSQYESSRGSS